VTVASRTVDAFLGGAFEAVQPAGGGHRSGLEAILLAAAIPSAFTGDVVDLGAGAGVAGFAVACRCPAARVTLVDRDPEALACAAEGLARPANAAFAGRVSIVSADVAAPEADRAAAGLGRESADLVVMNPPFRNAGAGTASPELARRAAHVLDADAPDVWVRTATATLRSGGRLVAIYRADGFAELLAALAGRFGDRTVLPVHPREGEPALRVIVAARKGSRGPDRLLQGFMLHGEEGGAYLPPAEQILRAGAALADVHPAWRGTL